MPVGDGAVIFMTDSVEAGDQDAPVISYYNKPGKPSPYGLWGALVHVVPKRRSKNS